MVCANIQGMKRHAARLDSSGGGLAGRVIAFAAALAGWAALGHAALPGTPNEGLCSAETGRYEQLYGIPAQLLDAISIVESGRWNESRRATTAWPWTITANGEGQYLPTKAEAVAEVKRLRAAGTQNIDVGCMQVNLHYHPDAFANLDEAFDPASNIAYAARFLKGLFGATNHWPTAASYYHSQTPKLAEEYRIRLMKVWTGAGAAARAAIATTIAPVPHQPQLLPRPSLGRVEEIRQARRDQAVIAHDEARQIADAYRQARLAEYQLRRAHMIENRQALGLPHGNY